MEFVERLFDRHGVRVHAFLQWSYYDPRKPNLQKVTQPLPPYRFIYTHRQNTVADWHVTLTQGDPQPTRDQMDHLVDEFDHKTMHLRGHVQGNSFYLDAAKGDPIASDPVAQQLTSRRLNEKGEPMTGSSQG